MGGPCRKDMWHIEAGEMTFLKQVEGCTLHDQIKNEDIKAQLGIYSMNDRIRQRSFQWKQHTERMNDD